MTTGILLVHNILPPYRVPLFNAVSDLCPEGFAVLLARETHPTRRKWKVPWESVRFDYAVLRTAGLEIRGRAIDLSFGVKPQLRSHAPRCVVVAGWDVSACWSALLWAKANSVPAVAWVETSARSGSFRGKISNSMRKAFLNMCTVALVPGTEAEDFVQMIKPGLPCVRMHNPVDAPELRRLPANPAGSALFVGELSERKGFDLILEGADQLLGVFDRILVAGTGVLKDKLLAKAAAEPRMRYLGFIEGPQFVDAMKESAVVLLPSRADPWPLVSVEALVAGRTLVAGPGVGSAPELQALAGASVVQMSEPSVHELIGAAKRARNQVVPESARSAFSVEAAAHSFLRGAGLSVASSL